MPSFVGALGVPDLSTRALVWVAVAYGVATLAQVLSGFGFALTCIPLLTLVLSRSDSVVSSTVLGMVSQSAMAWQLRTETDRDAIRWAMPASFLGMPIGIAVAHVVSDRALRIAVGVAVLVAVATIARGFVLRGRTHAIDAVAGVVSGVLATTTGTNGPPLVLAFAGRNMKPGVSRATLATMFAAGNLVALTLFALDQRINRVVLVTAAVGLVPVLSVRWLVEPLFRKLDQHRYRRLVLVLLTFAGIVAIVNALR